MLTLSPVTQQDIEHVAKVIKHPNVEQYVSALRMTPEQVIASMINMSEKSWVCRAGGIPLAIGGLRSDSFLSQSAEVWLFATHDIDRHGRSFLRACRQWRDEAMAMYPRLYAHVDELFEQSVEMLYWLGFEEVGRKTIRGMGANCIVMERNR